MTAYPGGMLYKGTFEHGKPSTFKDGEPHGIGEMTWLGEQIEALKDLNDETVVGDKTWADLKAQAMTDDYKEQDFWVSEINKFDLFEFDPIYSNDLIIN